MSARMRLLCLSWGHSWCDLFNMWGIRRGRRCDRCNKVMAVNDPVCVYAPGFNNTTEIEGLST
jgi:hypothetical protein